MFNCQVCHKTSELYVTPIKLIVAIKVHDFEITGRSGYDIASELSCCTFCAVSHSRVHPDKLRSRVSVLSYNNYMALKTESVISLDPDVIEDYALVSALASNITLGALATLRDYPGN